MKKLIGSMGFVALMMGFSFIAQASHCNTGAIMIKAHQLDEAAEHFSQIVESLTGYSHLTRDANKLAQSASHLHQVVESGYDCDHIRHDFQDVKRDYDHLEMAFRHAHDAHHDSHLQHDFNDVSHAYFNLRNEVGSGGGYGPVSQQVGCNSVNYGYRQCYALGNESRSIVSAQLIQQLSNAPCRFGQTWGYTNHYVWVSNGCRARINVRFGY